MGLFSSFLGALYKIICGPSDAVVPVDKPQEQRPPPAHKPPTSTPQAQPRPQQGASHHASGSHPPSHRPTQSHDRHNNKNANANSVNQQNEHYTSLRARANEEGDQMSQCFDRGHQAYANGDRAAAKDLSNQGKRHQQEMERLNKEASDWIFEENNKDRKQGEIDLHGLYVKEAIAFTDRAIEEARRRGDSEVHLIVGKGLHSAGGVAKLKPAIEDLIQKHQLVAQLDPTNAGVLIVTLNGPRPDAGKVIGTDDIARGINSKEGGCTIM